MTNETNCGLLCYISLLYATDKSTEKYRFLGEFISRDNQSHLNPISWVGGKAKPKEERVPAPEGTALLGGNHWNWKINENLTQSGDTNLV
jgi:hypothetical protein